MPIRVTVIADPYSVQKPIAQFSTVVLSVLYCQSVL